MREQRDPHCQWAFPGGGKSSRGRETRGGEMENQRVIKKVERVRGPSSRGRAT